MKRHQIAINPVDRLAIRQAWSLNVASAHMLASAIGIGQSTVYNIVRSVIPSSATNDELRRIFERESGLRCNERLWQLVQDQARQRLATLEAVRS